MKKYKLTAMLLSIALIMSMALTACGSKSDDDQTNNNDSSTSTGNEVWEQTFEADGNEYPSMTIGLATMGNMNDIASTPGCQGFSLFKNYMEGKSGGKIKVEIYDNSVLGSDEDMLEQVAQNSVQITTPMTSGLLTYDEEFGALDMPFLFASSDQAIAAMNGELGEYFKSTLDSSTGLTIAGYYYNGARSMTNNVRPITCVDD